MTFWIFLIALGIAWVLQSYLSFKQTQSFTKLFVAMRRRGRVAMGRFKGGIVQGAIVLFGIDDDGVITEGHRLNGVTVISRFRAFEDFTGQHIAAIDPAGAARHGRQVRNAVANARENYRIITAGGEAPEPPSALARSIGKVKRTFHRRVPTPTTD
jgi:glucitol operon activator